jgi:hypothetical protein
VTTFPVFIRVFLSPLFRASSKDVRPDLSLVPLMGLSCPLWMQVNPRPAVSVMARLAMALEAVLVVGIPVEVRLVLLFPTL